MQSLKLIPGQKQHVCVFSWPCGHSGDGVWCAFPHQAEVSSRHAVEHFEGFICRWLDPRLRYSHLVDHQSNFVLEGEDWFSEKIWTPNIYIENEVTSEVMSMNRDSVFIRILSSGEVNYNYRMRTTVLCEVELKRFPHDFQVEKISL